ncbi:hypothetical protein AB0M22_19840 [Nocardia sp. NPDC051756]|uniref:hypothetical protein n=1 Tax=Nocardia sp. NPDC051756 TaxID=3154751 RepID=UPI003430631C
MIIGAPPVDEYIDRWSLRTFGSAIAILIAVLLTVGAYCFYATISFDIIVSNRRFRYCIPIAWMLATAVLLTCWFTGDARATEATDPLGLPDLPSRIFTLTYAAIMAIAAPTTMIATWKALQRKDLRLRLRHAAWALFVAAGCTIGSQHP